MEAVPLPGDYNDDGKADAADYVPWRKHLGANTPLPNGTTPGSVMDEDYAVWRANFGAAVAGCGSSAMLTTGKPPVATAAAPEPTSCFLALATSSSWVFLRRRA